VNAIFLYDYPLAVEPGSTPRPLVQKKTWRDSLPIDMFLSAVSVLVVAQSSSEIPEGLMNNPVYCAVLNVWRRLPTSTFHCLRLFHSPTRRSLSFMAVYIPSFQVLRGRPRFSLPSGFQLIMIFGSRVGSILST